MNESVTEVFVEQPLASPGSAKNIYIDKQGIEKDAFSPVSSYDCVKFRLKLSWPCNHVRAKTFAVLYKVTICTTGRVTLIQLLGLGKQNHSENFMMSLQNHDPQSPENVFP